jgi:hypothetical protein
MCVESCQWWHERGRPERRLARKRAVQFEAESARERVPVHGGDLHEEVVRMLAVVQRLAPVGFTAL